MRPWLVALLKLAVVAAITAVVLASVDWTDRLVVTAEDGTVVEELTGRVEGRWDDPVEIRFRPAVTEEVPSPAIVTRPAGSQPNPDDPSATLVTRVAPGLLTFVAAMDPLLLALGALCYMTSLIVSGTRWGWLLRASELGLGTLQAIRLTFIGVFFTNVVPGQTGGDVAKAAYIMRRFPDGRGVALLSVLVDRLLGLASLVLLASVAVLFALDAFADLAIAIGALLVAVVVMAVLAFNARVRGLLADSRRLPGFITRPAAVVAEALEHYRSNVRGLVVWLIVGAVNHAVSVGSVVFIAMALGVGHPGVGVPLLDYYILVPIINVISSVPIAPNGWGVGEAAYAYLFGTYASSYLDVASPEVLMRTQAVALSVVFRLQITAWSLVGGLLVLFASDRIDQQDPAQ